MSIKFRNQAHHSTKPSGFFCKLPDMLRNMAEFQQILYEASKTNFCAPKAKKPLKTFMANPLFRLFIDRKKYKRSVEAPVPNCRSYSQESRFQASIKARPAGLLDSTRTQGFLHQLKRISACFLFC